MPWLMSLPQQMEIEMAKATTADGAFTVGDTAHVFGTWEGYCDYTGIVVAITAKSITVRKWDRDDLDTVYRLTKHGVYSAKGSWNGMVGIPNR